MSSFARDLRAEGALLALIPIWSIGWFLTEVGLSSSTPFSFTAARFVLAAIFMQLLLLRRRISYDLDRSQWVLVGLIGLFQTTLMFSLASYGMLEVGVARAAILIYSTPLWSSLLGRIFLNERFTPLKVFGLLLSCAGILVIVAPSLANGSVWGEAMLIASAMSWSASSLLLKKYLPVSDKLVVGTWQMTFGAAGLLALAFFVDGQLVFEWHLESALALLYVSTIGSVMAFTLWFYVVPRVDMLHSSMASLAVPVTVLIVDAAFLDRHLDAALLLGSSLIVAGILLSFVKDRAGRLGASPASASAAGDPGDGQRGLGADGRTVRTNV